ncbi:MAG: MaoC/PaaZ C-terminal domain-containing protein [Gemmataceae bacterium]
MSFTAMHLFFDDVAIGQEWESSGRTLTEADIVNYAGLSGDFNPIHVDHVFAAGTPFRKPIAHGLLVLSMASGLMIAAPPMRTLAFVEMKDWQFKAPVFIGDTIRCRTKVLEKAERARGRRGLVTWQRQVVNQNEQIVQEGQTVTLVEGRATLKGNGEAENSTSST